MDIYIGKTVLENCESVFTNAEYMNANEIAITVLGLYPTDPNDMFNQHYL
jgi:hypothetical protein